ncbi:MAG TPA: glycosyltransferase, partial [Alphaproteobacteria bacterium]|nr:glycosyltransferase [Alphaproteobacteria bacterium]
MQSAISIITVTYYTGPVLFDMIASALAQEGVAELVLVNNGNPLPIYRRLEEMAENDPRLKLISGQGNVGFATACNLGAKAAMGDYYLFLNPDCILPEGIAPKLLKASEKRARPYLIGARVVERDGKEQSGSRRAILTPWTAFVEVFGLYRFFPKHPYFRRFKWHEEPV